MKASEIAAKLGAAAKTEAELLAALDQTIALANEARPVMEALRKAMGKPEALAADVLTFANAVPVVPHEGMGGDVLGELHKQLANCIEMGKTKANELLAKVREVNALSTAKAAAEQAFANERKARTDLMIDIGMKEGKITLAEREVWQNDFANEATYQSAVDRYAKLAPKFSTRSHVNAPGAQHAGTANRMDQIEQFCNEERTRRVDAGEVNPPHDEVWAAVKKGHPELFAGMQEPKAERSVTI